MYKPNWRIVTAPDLKALEILVNKLQGEGYIIEDINTTSLVVVYHKYTEGEGKKELLLERQDEGRVPQPLEKDYTPGFEWDHGDYGQQLF